MPIYFISSHQLIFIPDGSPICVSLQAKKLEIAESVLTGAKRSNSSKLTFEDMKSLFGLA